MLYFLEFHILKIVSVEKHIPIGFKSNIDLVKVNLVVDSNGTNYRTSKIFDVYEWELVKEHGYYII
jgi:hypothetical protein